MSDMPPLKQGSGSIWVQPGGPNNPVRFLGCYDVDDIEEPLGEPTYIMCRQPDRTYKAIGEVTAPPEPVTTSLVGLTTAARDYLERMQCAGAIYILQSSCGRLDNFGNFDRAYILEEVRKTSRTISNAAHHVDDAETTQSFAISARPPLRTAVRVGIDRITTTETLSANDIAGNTDLRCSGDCGDQIDPGERLLIAIDSAVSPATANFLYSLDGLATSPLAAAVDPLAAGRSVQSVARFMVNRNTPRWLAASLATAGQQGSVAFSDDQGASWTTVNIGGAAAGHGAGPGRSLFVLDERHLYLAGGAGYIYKSEDGGASWAAVETGLLTANAYAAIHFCDELNGFAVAEAGVVVKTTDGGVTWTACTVIAGAPNIGAVFAIDRNRVWVGSSATGKLYYTTDGGVTWNERAFPTSILGTGGVRSISFIDEYVGYMIKNSAAPVGTVYRTINGGYTWEALTTPTNSGLNAVLAVEENLAYAVGEATGGTSVILKISD